MTIDPEDPPVGTTPDPAPDPDEQLGDAERKARKAAERRLQDADSRVQALQRAEIERVAGQAADGYKPLADPSDLWRADQGDLAAMLDEHGAVDPTKVREAVGRVVSAKPHWALQPPRVAGSADGGKGSAAEPSMDDLAARIVRGR